MTERLPDEKSPTFEYLDRVGEFVVNVGHEDYSALLEKADKLDDLGSYFVNHFGWYTTQQIISRVLLYAEYDLNNDPYDKLAKGAADWAKHSLERIGPDGWAQNHTSTTEH